MAGEQPRRIVILGGGIIGCEFASALARFGSEVTIVEMLPKLIPLEDDDASKELAKQFKKRGIEVRDAHAHVVNGGRSRASYVHGEEA